MQEEIRPLGGRVLVRIVAEESVTKGDYLILDASDLLP